MRIACTSHAGHMSGSRMDSRRSMSSHRARRKNMPSLHIISDAANKRGALPLEEVTLTFIYTLNNFLRFNGAHFSPVESLPTHRSFINLYLPASSFTITVSRMDNGQARQARRFVNKRAFDADVSWMSGERDVLQKTTNLVLTEKSPPLKRDYALITGWEALRKGSEIPLQHTLDTTCQRFIEHCHYPSPQGRRRQPRRVLPLQDSH